MHVPSVARVLVSLIVAAVGHADAAAVYQPVRGWVDPQVDALARLEYRLTAATGTAPVGGITVPSLRGPEPEGVRLLEGYMLRRHPKLLGNSPARARALIDRQYTRSLGPLRGYTAEAVFVDRNPEWNFVRSGNASQHDVTRRVAGRAAPFNGQIKYHNSGNPATYAADMVKDYRAHRFFIPDDHVVPTKAYLKQRAQQYAAQGDSLNAERLWRDYGRTRGIRATSAEIRSLTDEAGRFTAAEQRAIAAGRSGVRIGTTNWSTVPLRAGASASSVRAALNSPAYRMGRGRYIPAGIAQRANFLVGGVTAIALAVVLIHEHGGRYAFSVPAFYVDSVGSVTALAIAYYAGQVATSSASSTGLWAPVIGAIAGIAAGTAAYSGGRRLARAVIELFAPDVLQKTDVDRVRVARSEIDGRIRLLQDLN